MLSVFAFNYAVPELSYWQGYLGLALMLTLGVILLVIALRQKSRSFSVKYGLIIGALALTALAWPAKSGIHRLANNDAYEFVDKVQKQCLELYGKDSGGMCEKPF